MSALERLEQYAAGGWPRSKEVRLAMDVVEAAKEYRYQFNASDDMGTVHAIAGLLKALDALEVAP